MPSVFKYDGHEGHEGHEVADSVKIANAFNIYFAYM